jgi:hypothetical protein
LKGLSNFIIRIVKTKGSREAEILQLIVAFVRMTRTPMQSNVDPRLMTEETGNI